MGNSNGEIHLGLEVGEETLPTSCADFPTAGSRTATPPSISEAIELHSSELNLFSVCNRTIVEGLCKRKPRN